ncbi:hypothetical protein BDR05DRAFT_1026532 [Suillus weaverae]|nr:hypothetical protein BDR05DRAFT_1026532 [Suillus weaverae]
MVSSLPSLPSVLGTDPSSCILDAFHTAIAKCVLDVLPPLTIEQAYTGVDYGKKGIDFTVALPWFRLPGKPDELAKKVITDMQVSECLKRLGCMERHAFESYWRFGEILGIAEQEQLQFLPRLPGKGIDGGQEEVEGGIDATCELYHPS